MADTLDTYIKSPAPPKDPDSQYVYNEQQFGALEKTAKKQRDKILDVSATAQALYEKEAKARADADSAIVQTIETLSAKVDTNDTTTQATIENIQTAQADAESATATKLTTLEAKVDTGDAQNTALIFDEAKVRATKIDALASKISALEASVKTNKGTTLSLINTEQIARATADSAEAVARSNLQTYVGWDGGAYTKTLAASLSDEQSARANADISVAQRTMLTSAGTSRVYAQTTAPTASGRLTGDIWLDTTIPSGSTSPNMTPYVWYNNAWQNNSTGTYSQYAGNNATVTQLATAVNDTTNGLAYQWQLAGTAGTSGSTSSITLTGAAKKNADGTTTSASKIIMKAANITMDGDVIVTGSITSNQIDKTGNGVITDNIATSAITSIAGGSSASGNASTTITGVPGSTLLILGSIDGTVSVGVSSVTMIISVVVNGVTVGYYTSPVSTLYGYTPVRVDGNNLYASSNPGSFQAYGPMAFWGFSGNGNILPRTLQAQYQVTSTNTCTIYCGVYNGTTMLTMPMSVYVWQFKR